MTSYAKQIKPSSAIRIPSPLPSFVKKETASSFASRTDSLLYDQGITYNEAGLTYNEIGIAYGGVYGAQDKRNIVSFAREVLPHNHVIRDLPGQAPTPPPAENSGMLIGILGLTYP